jgi:anaerobic C4-dicarboxylate transporter
MTAHQPLPTQSVRGTRVGVSVAIFILSLAFLWAAGLSVGPEVCAPILANQNCFGDDRNVNMAIASLVLTAVLALVLTLSLRRQISRQRTFVLGIFAQVAAAGISWALIVPTHNL